MAKIVRVKPVRIRMSREQDAPTTEVALSETERGALEKAMSKTPFAQKGLGLGTFLRAIALRAAKDYTPGRASVLEVFEAAAADARQNVPEWIRTVALVAIEDSNLFAHLENAIAAYKHVGDWIEDEPQE